MSDFNVTEAMDLLHELAIQYNYLNDTALELLEAYDSIPLSDQVQLNDDMDALNEAINPIADNLKAYFLRSSHGGARVGAGRKQAAPTKQIRVDLVISRQFKELSDLYRSLSFDDQCILLKGLYDLQDSLSGKSNL